MYIIGTLSWRSILPVVSRFQDGEWWPVEAISFVINVKVVLMDFLASLKITSTDRRLQLIPVGVNGFWNTLQEMLVRITKISYLALCRKLLGIIKSTSISFSNLLLIHFGRTVTQMKIIFFIYGISQVNLLIIPAVTSYRLMFSHRWHSYSSSIY